MSEGKSRARECCEYSKKERLDSKQLRSTRARTVGKVKVTPEDVAKLGVGGLGEAA